ncbi:MAG: FGGY-family carbohydrate kinase [Candidatus Humimicrobiaceae bacterium]
MGKNKYILCIDNGLSVGKAALVDLEGNITEISSFKNETINDGRLSEIDMESFYNKTADVIKGLILSTNINPDDILSVGNSGHGGGIYLVDSSGDPVRNAITSMDSRVEDLIAKWKREGIDGYSKTYTNMWNGQAIPLFYWLKENERDNYSRTAKILFCKDWIKFRLTGQHSTDYTDASNAGLIDLASRDYDAKIYKMYGLAEISEKLPQLKRSDEIAGYITKEAAVGTCLKEGTPVIGGLVDFIACLVGSGLKDTSTYSVVSGTWGINTAIKSNLTISPDIMATVLFPDNINFLAMDTSPNSAVNLEWFLSEIVEKMGCPGLERKQIYKKIDEEIKKIDIDESCVFYFPFIYRSKLSKKMEGAIYGFNASHDLYDLIYSIYEGVVFSHLMHINNLRKGGINCNRLVLSGGASNSSLWCQIFSDILNMEVMTTSTEEVGIIGLAIYQALGLGLYSNLKEAINNMVRIKTIYKPDTRKNDIYMKRFLKFEQIRQSLDQ